MTYRASVAVALIDQHICPCPECPGQLALRDDFPSWRRCTECRCSWRVEDRGRVRRAACVSGHPCQLAAGEARVHSNGARAS